MRSWRCDRKGGAVLERLSSVECSLRSAFWLRSQRLGSQTLCSRLTKFVNWKQENGASPARRHLGTVLRIQLSRHRKQDSYGPRDFVRLDTALLIKSSP